ncbi:MAG: hypothetical protein IPH37_20260 [Burkholderiales bacterium]|nr:hypothetical protein [Burkholderiales bacterium]
MRNDSRHDGILLIQLNQSHSEVLTSANPANFQYYPALQNADATRLCTIFKRNFKPSSMGVKPGQALELLRTALASVKSGLAESISRQ